MLGPGADDHQFAASHSAVQDSVQAANAGRDGWVLAFAQVVQKRQVVGQRGVDVLRLALAFDRSQFGQQHLRGINLLGSRSGRHG